jgi:hypothetical protein
MKTLTFAAIRCSLMFTAVTASLFSVQPTQAGYIVTLQEVGPNVVASGSGAIDLTGLAFFDQLPNIPSFVSAAFGVIDTGLPANTFRYSGATGPTSFGSGNVFLANTSSGDLVGIAGNVGPPPGGIGVVTVPEGYVSGTALSDSATYSNASFAILGLTPGTYVWTWGTGLPNQNFTLQIGGAGVPDSGSTVSLLGCALLGLAALRRKLSC